MRNLSCQVPTNTTSTNATLCFQSFVSVLRSSSRDLATIEYTAVHNVTLNVVSGNNFITLPPADVFKAEPGDVIGYILDQSERSNLSLSSVASNTSSNMTSAADNMLQNFSIYGFVPYEAKVSIRVTNPGVWPLGITVTELKGVVIDYRNLITVQRPVSGLMLRYQAIIRINTTQLIGFELSRGTNSHCDWLLVGDEVGMGGSVNHTTQSANDTIRGNHTSVFEGLETSFQYAHDVADDITFSVNCSNKVSTLSENVTISVRRNISDFQASLCFASFAYTHAQTCWKASQREGDHVGYRWTIEDEDYRTAKVDLEMESSSLPLSKTRVDVTAWNVVSRESLLLWLDVLRNPLDILVLPALSVASRETVNIVPALNWTPYGNGTALYTDYGINISNALQEFIHFPTFEVKIDDSLISGNVSNGSLLAYTFPKAGSESVIHDVYIHAKGHEEMNRKIEVRVLDRVEGVRIVPGCSDQIVVGQTCRFTPEFDGSDTSCDWTVASQSFKDTCNRITPAFDELGNFTVTLSVSNKISSQNAVYNITVVSKDELLPTSSITSSVTMTASSVTMTASSVTMTTSPTMSLLSSAITASSSKPGPSSQSVPGPAPQTLRIIGPEFVAVGEMVTFHASNVASSARLFWVVNNTRLPTSNHSISYSFLHPGKFEIIVNSSTSDENASLTVIVQDPISGFQVFVFQKQLSKRVDVLFSIDSGTDVSYSINFGDNSETNVCSVGELGVIISVYHLYSQPGYYNLSVSVVNKVGANKTEYRKISVTCFMESAVLYGASSDVHNPSQFSDKDVIVLALKTILNCTANSTLKYSWKVGKLNSSIPKEPSIKLVSGHEAVLRILGKALSNGHYKVEVNVENSVNETILTRFGYFHKVSETLVVRIACGTARMVSVNEPLTMNASVIAGSANVTYQWYCGHVSDVVCFGNDIRRNTPVLRFPRNSFNVSEEYVFVVKVSDGLREGLASQKVTFASSNTTLDLCLR